MLALVLCCALQPVTAHTTPLLLGAMRLLPAGLALVAWAAATGRPQPKTATAWAWVLAFAIVDGAAFQVRSVQLADIPSADTATAGAEQLIADTESGRPRQPTREPEADSAGHLSCLIRHGAKACARTASCCLSWERSPVQQHTCLMQPCDLHGGLKHGAARRVSACLHTCLVS